MSEELINNGDFETGDFTGWIVNDLFGEPTPGDMWLINDGYVEIPFPLPIPTDIFYASDPISGDYDAISDYTLLAQFGLPVSFLFQQNVTLPSNISSATLSWKDRIYSYAPFCEESPVQFFAVGIEDGSGSTTVLFTSEGNPIQLGPNSRSITEFEDDGVILSLTEFLQSLEGQEVTIIFVLIAETGPLFVTVDDISLDIDTVLPVEIDIKPGSYPNCFNINGHGVIPVAILGSADLEVSQIKVETLSFAGLEVRVRGNKGPLCSTEDLNGDTIPDLVCLFEDEPENWTVGTESEADLTGELLDGTPISGTDAICIVP